MRSRRLLAFLPLLLLTAGSRPGLAQQPSVTLPAGSASVPLLLSQVADSSRHARDQAWKTFEALGPRAAEAVPELVRLLRNGRPHARIGAAEALFRISFTSPLSPSVMPVLLHALGDSIIHVRGAAALALGNSAPRDEAAIAALVRLLLSDPAPGVRGAAAEALGATGHPAAAGALLQALADPVEFLRLVRIPRALHQLGPAAIPQLRTALRAGDPSVRAAAARALGSIGPAAQAALPELLPLITDADSVVASLAAHAAGRILPRLDQHVTPMRAQVLSEGHSLRDDGRGAYVMGVDSASVYGCRGLNIQLGSTPWASCADPEYEPTRLLNLNGPERRALAFDLRDPVEGSGAVPLGLIRDEKAEVHVLWKHDPDARIIWGTHQIPRGREDLQSERVELHLTIDGRRHELQFGPWVHGLFGGSTVSIHGEGTTRAQLARRSETRWRVTAPKGSIARLWDVSDPKNPKDRGLYRFSFAIDWEALGPP